MKNKTFLLFLSVMMSMFILTGCEEDDEEVTPDDPRDDFVGLWNCEDNLAKRDNYQVTIQEDASSDDEVFLYNFGSMGSSVAATGEVTSSSISVPLQELSVDQWSVDGQGVMVGENTIEWTYTIDNGSDRFDYIAVFSR